MRESRKIRRTQNTLTGAGTVPYSTLTHVLFLCHFPPTLPAPHFTMQIPFIYFTALCLPQTNSPRWVPPQCRRGYPLCTVVCVMGLYIITLLCNLCPKSLLWLAPAGWAPAVAAGCTCGGFSTGGAGSCCPFLVGAASELTPGRAVLHSDWLSWTFSLCPGSFGRLFDFFSRIICRTEKLVRLNTAIQQKNKTSKQRRILINICNLFCRVSNKYNFGTRWSLK